MEFSCRAPHPVTVVLKLAVDQSGGVDDRSVLKSERFGPIYAYKWFSLTSLLVLELILLVVVMQSTCCQFHEAIYFLCPILLLHSGPCLTELL